MVHHPPVASLDLLPAADLAHQNLVHHLPSLTLDLLVEGPVLEVDLAAEANHDLIAGTHQAAG